MKDALEAVKVVELGGYAAGPCIGKYLANFGAQVLHVESTQHPDGFRLQYPPYKDGKVGINRSGCFAFFSDSKRGVTINLKHPKGQELGYRMMEWADILIENMRPGVVARMGFGYDVLRERNPGLIMLSTSNLGQTGPHATHPGFGSQLSSLSGFCHLIGEADGPPHMLYGPYIDFIAVAYGGTAVLAALDQRRRTGEGAYIDLSQYECGLQFIGGALLDYSANGAVADRAGNRDPGAAPHGCFPCEDGQWCVISCWSDGEWVRLCHVAEQNSWLTDARFRTAAGRKEHEEALNQLIGAWISEHSADAVIQQLQHAGIHAAKVNTMRDLFSDPQIKFREIWQEREHPEIGPHRYRMVSYQLSETPGSVRAPAPCLGEHNEEGFLEWLKLSADEYRDFQDQGVFC
ncbi:MAG TPA: CoA transferase [Bryobacteraceae bacterium]|nr:CoA transferase [Bryobacteraceae bacterium]